MRQNSTHKAIAIGIAIHNSMCTYVFILASNTIVFMHIVVLVIMK